MCLQVTATERQLLLSAAADSGTTEDWICKSGKDVYSAAAAKPYHSLAAFGSSARHSSKGHQPVEGIMRLLAKQGEQPCSPLGFSKRAGSANTHQQQENWGRAAGDPAIASSAAAAAQTPETSAVSLSCKPSYQQGRE
jgi:hypothetical protein